MCTAGAKSALFSCRVNGLFLGEAIHLTYIISTITTRLTNKHHQHGVDDGLELKHSLFPFSLFSFVCALSTM